MAAQRLSDQRARGNEAAFTRAAAVAARSNDLRTHRRAVELGKEIVRSDSSRAAAVTRTLRPSLGALSQHCGAAHDAVAFLRAASADADAVRVLTWEVSQCRHVRAGLEASAVLRSLSRCPEALRVARTTYAVARGDERVAVFDEVARCSSDVDLRQNLSFASADELAGYYQILERREHERRVEEQRQMQEEALRAQQQAIYDGCVNQCSARYANCSSAACYEAEQNCVDACG